MESSLLYWIFEYIKVLVAYGLILFVWPSVVFRKFLKDKSITYRFGFCTTVQVIIINSAVLLLGLFHLLNRFTMYVFFIGILLWSLREELRLTEKKRNTFRYLITGTFGKKHFFLKYYIVFRKWLKKSWKNIRVLYKKHFVEYTLLIITVIYGMLYFTWGAFHDFSYGFGDMYVHHSWVYGLIEGQIFYEGVYPEAMHCVLYTLHSLFGIDVYSCVLYLAGAHIPIILLAMYCFMKEVFHWRYSAIFVLIFYLTVDVVCVNEVFSMSRLQWTLPQEYGFHTIYLCTLFLIRYLNSAKEKFFKVLQIKIYWDENLLLFMLSLAASISIHFYATIMAFLICVGFVCFYLKKIFHKKHFFSLVFAAILGVLIAIIPMGGALASGIPFQGSIGWAVNIMNGIDPEAGYTSIAGNDTIQEPDDGYVVDDATVDNYIENNVPEISGTTDNTVIQSQIVEKSLVEKLAAVYDKLIYKVKEKWKIIYDQAYVTLYKIERANWIIGFSCLVVTLGFVYKIVTLILRFIFKKKEVSSGYFANYLSVVVATFIYMVMYCAAHLGLPGLVAGARLCSTEQLLILIVIIVPIDIIFAFLDKYSSYNFMQTLSVITACGLVAFIYLTGNFHGYLYYELTRYNVAVNTTNKIIDSLPENKYTIVSTTDEIYQVIQSGRHEEMLTFLEQNRSKGNYTIPTEYIFIYVEKRPIKYAHNHFFSGPAWIADEKYQDIYEGHNPSVCPDIVHGEISDEMASQSIMYLGKPSDSYSNITSRIILESKMYNWCESFKEMYPNDIGVFYEDEDFVCYYIKQNPQFLFNLVLP